MEKEKIIERLQKHWDFAIQQGFNQDMFLGIFLYGSQNYNTSNDDSDVDSIIVVIPSFNNFCLSKNWLSKELHFGDEHIILKDIRSIREMFMKQNINYLEILFTEYFILNPKYYADFHKYFVKNREVISHYNREKTVKSVTGQLLHTLRQDPTDEKKLYNAHRLYFFLRDYLDLKPYEECIRPTGEDHDFLMDLKYKDTYHENAKKKLAELLEKDVLDMVLKNVNIQSPDSKAAAAAIDEGTIEILKESFDLNKKPKEISKKEFFKKLTNSETRAYYSIIKEIHEEGNITIQKLVEKNSISRPVYTNLIVKLKENNVAEVNSMGMKGTYIRITQSEMLAEAVDFI